MQGNVAGQRTFPYRRGCPYDPPRELFEWHGESPVSRITLWNGRRAWLATGLEEVRTIMRDHDVFSSDPAALGFPTLSAADEASKVAGLLPVTDPPAHDVLRRAVQSEFTVRRVAHKRAETEVIIAELFDRMADRGPPLDLIEWYAAEVPARFTCRLLGVPLEDAGFFRDCLGGRFDPGADQASVVSADAQLASYFVEVVAERKRESRDDLSGRLVRDHVETGGLTDRQAASLLHVLLIGGFDTTRNMIAMGTILLLEHPEVLDRLASDPAGWPTAMEEMLRYLSVVQYERRAVTADVQLGDRQLRAGDGVLTVLHIANRDGRELERPNDFVADRDPNNHVAFGFGIHQCLGQPVARMMLQLAYPALFDRFPGLRVEVPKEGLVYNEGRTIWGPASLPVAW